MDTYIRRFFESVGVLFTEQGTRLPCYTSDIVFQWECFYANSSNDQQKNKKRRKVLRALVHSEQPDDVQYGITFLEGSLLNTINPMEKRKEMYLLAVGYFNSREYSKGRDLISACLEITPQLTLKWFNARILQNLIEDGLKKDEIKSTLMSVASTVGVVARVLTSTNTLSSYPTLGFKKVTIKNLTEYRVEKASLPNASNPLQIKEEMYLLAHRYYLRRDYTKSEVITGICSGVAITTVCIVAVAFISKKK